MRWESFLWQNSWASQYVLLSVPKYRHPRSTKCASSQPSSQDPEFNSHPFSLNPSLIQPSKPITFNQHQCTSLKRFASLLAPLRKSGSPSCLIMELVQKMRLCVQFNTGEDPGVELSCFKGIENPTDIHGSWGVFTTQLYFYECPTSYTITRYGMMSMGLGPYVG